MSLEEFAERLNTWGSQRTPFLFLVDFEMQRPQAFRLDEIDAGQLVFNINGRKNCDSSEHVSGPVDFVKVPPVLADYKPMFDYVHGRLSYGDSYLTNLTIRTQIYTALSLRDLFFLSEAKYKLLFENRFLVFSPETFILIRDGKITAYPMKGTIDASVQNARTKILDDCKERAEHVTIVDLLRNDLSMVADRVSVTRFRYIDEIRTLDKNLLQVSSEISGDLSPGYEKHFGDILLKLLPAGSVSGAPKCKTLEIIREAEGAPRGYYTGVAGIYDGQTFESAVMIRFIERDGQKLYYRSGGGITAQSDLEKEYQEAIDKVYVPVG